LTHKKFLSPFTLLPGNSKNYFVIKDTDLKEKKEFFVPIINNSVNVDVYKIIKLPEMSCSLRCKWENWWMSWESWEILPLNQLCKTWWRECTVFRTQGRIWSGLCWSPHALRLQFLASEGPQKWSQQLLQCR